MQNLASGIIAAPPLPFNDDGTIDWSTLERYIAQVAAGGPRAIAMNMAASEVSSLELDEQLEVIRRCKTVIGGACTLLSGVSMTHTAAARDVAQMVDAGAEGVVPFPPLPAFTAPIPVPMVEAYHRAVAEAVDVPIVAFQTAATQYPKGTITALAEDPERRVDQGRVVQHRQHGVEHQRSEGGAAARIGVLTGSDTFVLEAMLMGCDGALIGLGGTATAELVRMQALAERGNVAEAYEIWNRIGPLARLCWRPPLRDFRVRTKYVLVKQGVFAEFQDARPVPGARRAGPQGDRRGVAPRRGSDPRFLPAGKRA